MGRHQSELVVENQGELEKAKELLEYHQVHARTLSTFLNRRNLLSGITARQNIQDDDVAYRWVGGDIQKKLEKAFMIQNHDWSPALGYGGGFDNQFCPYKTSINGIYPSR